MKNFFTNRSSQHDKGESFVWLTAMGLTSGLIMVAFLVGLVFINGLEVFWPKNIYEFTIQDGKKSITLAGEIIKSSQKRSKGQVIPEIQIYTGNKDVYRQSFRFIDEHKIINKSQPNDLAHIERREYGSVIARMNSLELKDGKKITSENQDFPDILNKEIGKINDRWNEIEDIEKHEIGKINSRLTKLKLQQKQENSETIKADIEQATKDYQKLAAQARALRAEQKTVFLNYTLASGQKKRMALGKVIHVIYSNQMNPIDKLIEFSRRFALFLWDNPREANTEGGIFPAIFGTFVMTVLMSIVVMPFGVLTAVYLREYAKQGLLVRLVRISVNNLAGVPSIVFGVFGLGFFIYTVGSSIDQFFFSDRLPTPTFGTGGILWASLTLALMTVPVVIVATEEALSAVPRGIREASLACGASKWQTIRRVVLPTSLPGIITGLILAMARGAGEVAPLMLVGVVKLAPSLPIDGTFPFIHLERKFMHLGFHIYDLGFQSPDSEAAKPMVFATTLILIGMVLLLNLGAIYLREKLKKRYATSSF